MEQNGGSLNGNNTLGSFARINAKMAHFNEAELSTGVGFSLILLKLVPLNPSHDKRKFYANKKFVL